MTCRNCNGTNRNKTAVVCRDTLNCFILLTRLSNSFIYFNFFWFFVPDRIINIGDVISVKCEVIAKKIFLKYFCLNLYDSLM